MLSSVFLILWAHRSLSMDIIWLSTNTEFRFEETKQNKAKRSDTKRHASDRTIVGRTEILVIFQNENAHKRNKKIQTENSTINLKLNRALHTKLTKATEQPNYQWKQPFLHVSLANDKWVNEAMREREWDIDRIFAALMRMAKWARAFFVVKFQCAIIIKTKLISIAHTNVG